MFRKPTLIQCAQLSSISVVSFYRYIWYALVYLDSLIIDESPFAEHIDRVRSRIVQLERVLDMSSGWLFVCAKTVYYSKSV